MVNSGIILLIFNKTTVEMVEKMAICTPDSLLRTDMELLSHVILQHDASSAQHLCAQVQIVLLEITGRVCARSTGIELSSDYQREWNLMIGIYRKFKENDRGPFLEEH